MPIQTVQPCDSARFREHPEQPTEIGLESAESQAVDSDSKQTGRQEEEAILDRLDSMLARERKHLLPESAKVDHRLHERHFNHQLTRHLAFAFAWVLLVLFLGFASGHYWLWAVAIGYLIGTLFTFGISQHAFFYPRAICPAAKPRS